MKAFSSYDPVAVFVYFLAVMLGNMFFVNPIFQLEALVGAALFCSLLHKPKQIAENTAFYAALLLMIAISNPIFSHNGVTPLFFMNSNPVTLEALVYGAALGVTVISTLMWCTGFNAVMTSDKLLYLFGRAAPKLSLTLSMALRFVPMFIRQFKKVSRAQKAMGLYSSKGFVDKLASRIRVFGATVSWSLENAMETSASMKARGYGIKGRSSFFPFKFSGRDGVLLGVSVMLIGITAVGSATGITDFYYYPAISSLNLTPAAAGFYAAYGVLCLLPFIIEVREALLWKYSVSKI